MIRSQNYKSFKAALIEWPFALIIVLLLSGCGSNVGKNKPGVEIVAEVGYHYLTSEELVKVFGKDWKQNQDEVKNFIRIWAKDKVVGVIAEKKLNDSDKDFEREIYSYKNSLLKYKFEQKMLDTALSLDVNEDELSKYFNKNKKNFQLKENIVRVRYVKIPKKHKKLKFE